jgi:hypothetical protein
VGLNLSRPYVDIADARRKSLAMERDEKDGRKRRKRDA